MASPPGQTGPIIVGYDGSPKSRHALHRAAALLAPAPAVVVVVWEPGGAFEAVEPGIEAAPIDIGGALEVDKAMSDRAQAEAEEGARLARQLGFDAEGVAVADELSVAETLLRVAADRQAAAIVVGTHGHKPVRDLLLGSTSRNIVGHADCPVVVVREPEPT
ncbi:MAG: universal stress protein [Actinomycetota bacterium]|nr:universal stress protein [Actinomycetota bacterium]